MSFDIILIQIFKKMPTPVKSGLRLGGLWRLVLTVTYALVRYTVSVPNIILRTENNNRQRPPLGGRVRPFYFSSILVQNARKIPT